jgi:two-component system chemotaxis response regulator CheB
LVVIGASAGGVDALKQVVAGLDADLPAAVCVVLHLSPSSPSALARILDRAGSLRARQAEDGAPLLAGEILVAPPDRHLVIEDGHVRLSAGPRENGHRPAVDPLFRSAAQSRDGRVIGVILSGNRDDGSAGLAAIKAGGGVAIVQDPADALYDGMPSSAIANVTVDTVAPTSEIAGAIAAMVSKKDGNPDSEAALDPASDPPSNEASISVCPDCGGVLTEEIESGVPQWRCMIGHRYSSESLAEAQALAVERALETAIRALEERGALLQRMAEQCEERAQVHSAEQFRRRAHDARNEADLVRTVLREAAEGTLRIPEGGQAEQSQAQVQS